MALHSILIQPLCMPPQSFCVTLNPTEEEEEEKGDYEDGAINIDEVSSPINRLESYKGMLLTTYLFVNLNLLFIKYY